MRNRTASTRLARALLPAAAVIPLLAVTAIAVPHAFAAPAGVSTTTVQAEAYTKQVGARVQRTSDVGGGRNVG